VAKPVALKSAPRDLPDNEQENGGVRETLIVEDA